METDGLFICPDYDFCEFRLRPDEECNHGVPHIHDGDCPEMCREHCWFSTGISIPPSSRKAGCVELANIVVVRDEECLDAS